MSVLNTAGLIKFTNRNIKKIVCVYQLCYTDNVKSPGIGDFIRGCFYVMQLSSLLGLEFDIDISNHPMQKYIENSGKNSDIDYNKIEYIPGLNRPPHLWRNNNNYLDVDFANQLIRKLNNHNSNTFALFTNAFPIFYNFRDAGRQLIKNRLKPTSFMENYVDRTLNELQLEKNKYATIHIRTGDEYLTNSKTININFIQKIKKKINKLIVPNKKYLIISDSVVLKLFLKSYPNFYMVTKKIKHLGGQRLNSTEETSGVMNTLLDFYLMSYSKSIFCLGVYGHISGFSRYCGAINEIPFNFILL
jgi:hypothetical protein